MFCSNCSETSAIFYHRQLPQHHGLPQPNGRLQGEVALLVHSVLGLQAGGLPLLLHPPHVPFPSLQLLGQHQVTGRAVARLS